MRWMINQDGNILLIGAARHIIPGHILPGVLPPVRSVTARCFRQIEERILQILGRV